MKKFIAVSLICVLLGIMSDPINRLISDTFVILSVVVVAIGIFIKLRKE